MEIEIVTDLLISNIMRGILGIDQHAYSSEIGHSSLNIDTATVLLLTCNIR